MAAMDDAMGQLIGVLGEFALLGEIEDAHDGFAERADPCRDESAVLATGVLSLAVGDALGATLEFKQPDRDQSSGS
jgi:hypothetical protein